MAKTHVPGLEAVAETLLIPLCYRAVEARRPDALVRDECAGSILAQLGVDPAHLKWREPQHVFAMLRARQMDRWAADFLAQHPRAVVVEIGCGLDARYERLDSAQADWTDLDLPEVIDIRRRFFAETPRRRMLPSSVFELGWMDQVPRGDAHLFLAEGVFAYFEETAVREVFAALAGRFPGAELVVDALSPFMVQFSALVPWFRGYQVRPRWGVADPRSLEQWGPWIRLLDSYGYFDRPEPRMAGRRWMAWFPTFRESAHVLRLRLGEARS